jgi:hypothetical protein
VGCGRVDCRVHFVLFSGAVSKTWLKEEGAFVPLVRLETMQQQLEYAALAAVTETLTFNYAKKEIHLPKIFKWYQSNFGVGDGGDPGTSLLSYLAEYFPPGSAERNSISNFLAIGKFNLKYKSFPWNSMGIGLADSSLVAIYKEKEKERDKEKGK